MVEEGLEDFLLEGRDIGGDTRDVDRGKRDRLEIRVNGKRPGRKNEAVK